MMPDSLALRARRALALADSMKSTDRGLLSFWDASHALDKLRVSGLMEELAREYLRLRDLETTAAWRNHADLGLMPTKPKPD